MNDIVVTCAPDFRLPMHRHDDARIILITSGEISETDILGERKYRAGEIIFRPPFYLHGNGACDIDAEYVRLPVSRGALKTYTAKSGWRSGRGRIDFTKWSVARLCGDHFGGDLLLEFVTACEASEEFDCQNGGDLHALAGELRNGPDACMQLTRRAEKLGLEPYQLTRRFNRKFGLTPSAYGREARLYRALQLLMSDGPSLSQVAALSGYADQSHFSRDIAGVTERTPSQLAREFRAA